MEAAQEDLLERASISRFDGRLRGWREEARKLFERACARATRTDLGMGENELARLYSYCISRVLRANGIEVRNEPLSDDDQLIKLLDGGTR
jgi:predicted trehalose synthase